MRPKGISGVRAAKIDAVIAYLHQHGKDASNKDLEEVVRKKFWGDGINGGDIALARKKAHPPERHPADLHEQRLKALTETLRAQPDLTDKKLRAAVREKFRHFGYRSGPTADEVSAARKSLQVTAATVATDPMADLSTPATQVMIQGLNQQIDSIKKLMGQSLDTLATLDSDLSGLRTAVANLQGKERVSPPVLVPPAPPPAPEVQKPN